MAQHTRDVHGHKVFHEDDALQGVDYLDHRLEYPESEVFFQTAKFRGKAEFEDGENRNFTLRSNGDGTYTILRRKSSGGFFSGWF